MDHGSEHLSRKSAALRNKDKLDGAARDFLVIDDETIDNDRLCAMLRVVLGYDVSVRHVQTIGQAIDALIEKPTDVVLLDDILKPSDTALESIPLIRRTGFDGPIVVISGQATRRRRGELIAAGAHDVIHKDDMDSVRLTEILARLLADQPKK